jgi:hypothetical protein
MRRRRRCDIPFPFPSFLFGFLFLFFFKKDFFYLFLMLTSTPMTPLIHHHSANLPSFTVLTASYFTQLVIAYSYVMHRKAKCKGHHHIYSIVKHNLGNMRLKPTRSRPPLFTAWVCSREAPPCHLPGIWTKFAPKALHQVPYAPTGASNLCEPVCV